MAVPFTDIGNQEVFREKGGLSCRGRGPELSAKYPSGVLHESR